MQWNWRRTIETRIQGGPSSTVLEAGGNKSLKLTLLVLLSGRLMNEMRKNDSVSRHPSASDAAGSGHRIISLVLAHQTRSHSPHPTIIIKIAEIAITRRPILLGHPILLLRRVLQHRLKFLVKFLDLRPDYKLTVLLPRIQIEVVLVVLLRRIELFERRDFGHDRRRKGFRRIQLLLVLLRDSALLIVVIKNRRPILRAAVVALAIERRRIMRLPKDFQKIFERNNGGIIRHLNHFR